MRWLDDKLNAALAALRQAVQIVDDLVFDGDGGASGTGPAGDDVDADVLYQLGFYSRPLDGARGVVLKLGGRGNASLLLGFRDRQYEVTLEKGEVALASPAGAVVKLDKDGQVLADAAAGKKVKVQGGGADAARNGDPTGSGTLEILGGVGTFFTGLKYIDADGTVTTLNATGQQAHIKGRITGGSSKTEIG